VRDLPRNLQAFFPAKAKRDPGGKKSYLDRTRLFLEVSIIISSEKIFDVPTDPSPR